MNKVELVRNYIEKSEENFKLYEFLSAQPEEQKFIDWQAVSIFYSSLCFVKAYLFSMDSVPETSLNSHREIMYWLTTEINSKRLMIYEKYYKFLYDCARDARYKCRKTNKKIVERMLLKNKDIKRLLNSDIQYYS